MSDEPYVIPDNPEFEDNNIRALKTSDPANAETIFNPLFLRILSNIRAVWQKINLKADKVDGKGFSSNDYTDEDKAKLTGLSNYDDSDLQGKVSANTTAIAAIPSTPLTMTAQLTAGGAQDLATKQVRNVTISPSDPSGGSNGDMWFKYS